MDRLGKTRLLLTQSIAPNVTPPPPVDRIMKGEPCLQPPPPPSPSSPPWQYAYIARASPAQELQHIGAVSYLGLRAHGGAAGRQAFSLSAAGLQCDAQHACSHQRCTAPQGNHGALQHGSSWLGHASGLCTYIYACNLGLSPGSRAAHDQMHAALLCGPTAPSAAGIASRQARNLVEDLRAEIARRRAAQERSQVR